MRLGKHQLCLLASMASPFNLLIVGDRISQSLVDRKFLAPHSHGAHKDGAFLASPRQGLEHSQTPTSAVIWNSFTIPSFAETGFASTSTQRRPSSRQR